MTSAVGETGSQRSPRGARGEGMKQGLPRETSAVGETGSQRSPRGARGEGMKQGLPRETAVVGETGSQRSPRGLLESNRGGAFDLGSHIG